MRPSTITRMELLALKTQINLAKQGRELLEQKRTALMKELLELADMVIERSDALEHAAADASLALVRAKAIAGSEFVKSAALASRAEYALEVRTVNIMGIRVPHIKKKPVKRPAFARGYSIVGTSITIDEAASAFEAEVNAIIHLAESELRLKRLAEEIGRTSRRLNALDHLLIPRLEADRDFIQLTLDERERDDHFRLKLMKKILEQRRGY